MHLKQQVSDAFAPHGPLAQATDAFLPREGQTRMALAVADAVARGGALVVEAGTGVGKTFAYLVPTLLSGERVLLSTATKALQDQLFSRDLPRLAQSLGIALRAALLKGRASYLCLHRMELARRDATLPDRSAVMALARVEDWSRSTRTGDLAELPALDERSPVIPLVTSTRDNCLGSDCPQFRSCHVNQARREALAADVVVINHHLFFADLTVRESGMAELLPSVRVVVFDEAHQLNETGVEFLGTQLGTAQLVDLARDLLASGLQQARGLAEWQALAGGIERAARDLRLLFGRMPGGARRRWTQPVPEGIDAAAWQSALDALRGALDTAGTSLQWVQDAAPDFGRLLERCLQATALVQRFAEPAPAGCVRWADAGTHLRLVESPLDIAQAVRERMLGQGRPAAAEADAHDEPKASDAAARGFNSTSNVPPERQRTWVFTSATLGDDDRLSWFTEPCGLESAEVLRVASPFDYPAQAALYVPASLPRPGDAAHTEAVADLAAQAVRRLGGRAMVLTTTLRALQLIGDRLERQLGADALGESRIEVLVQGRLPKRRLIERFREGDAQGRPGCVLVASASFWEGVDVPGDALQLVIIDKLPFPPPGDPLVEARSARCEASGRSAFNAYFVPEAAVSLKQGAGRLIRTESDRGVLVVCDPRLATMGYGRRLVQALPPMRRLKTAQEFEEALDELRAPASDDGAPAAITRTSTTDR